MTSADHLSSVQRFVMTCLSFTPASSSFDFSSGGASAMRFAPAAIIASTPLLTASAHELAELPLLPHPIASAAERNRIVFMAATVALPLARRSRALQHRVGARATHLDELLLRIRRKLPPPRRRILVDRDQRIARVLGQLGARR